MTSKFSVSFIGGVKLFFAFLTEHPHLKGRSNIEVGKG